MATSADLGAARRCVLAVSVLEDLDLLPGDAGVLLTGPGPQPSEVLVGWAEVIDALGPYDPVSATGRFRVAVLLRLRRLLAGLPEPASRLRPAARLLALPPGHALHPGTDWVRARLPGGALDLGVGLLGLAAGADVVCPLPPDVAVRTGCDSDTWWPDLAAHAERMGALAAGRLGPGRLELRPVGGCDALSLLSSAALRRELAGRHASGLGAAAVPVRRRAWLDPSWLDPAFVHAAWSLTAEPDRGLPRPLLVTPDEIALSAAAAP